MNLSKITDSELLKSLKDLVEKERSVLTEILRYLKEVEMRRLFLARGYPSLFAFCREALGYSEGEAHVRIQAMRLIAALPQTENHISERRLSLTVAAQAQGQFRRTEKTSDPIETAQKAAIIEELLDTSAREAERKLATHFPETKLPREKTRALSKELTRIEFNANRQLCEKLEKLKALLAHKNFSGRMDLLIEELADQALQKLDPEAMPKKKTKQKPMAKVKNDAPLLEAEQVAPTRYIRAEVKREVWKRDQGKCQYLDLKTGKKCGTSHGLQIDHIQEFHKGGSSDLKNVRLLCGAHNRWRSRHSVRGAIERSGLVDHHGSVLRPH